MEGDERRTEEPGRRYTKEIERKTEDGIGNKPSRGLSEKHCFVGGKRKGNDHILWILPAGRRQANTCYAVCMVLVHAGIV